MAGESGESLGLGFVRGATLRQWRALYWAMLRSASRGGAQWARVQAALREQAALSHQVVMRKHDLRRACASVAAAANAAANAQCSLADAFLCAVPCVSRFAQYAE